ncbi:hypothetical protein L1987_43281 [Smallanthus sonchifolius]|uniref:Uncharacterized protein n=1 Tax=Smallanthus sonchifolius TaxID=185202 RepID=A0ACB9GLA9_9ASTR|nr:hypothetical protein L1987_43281 [Smallanthus sonchifolius]
MNSNKSTPASTPSSCIGSPVTPSQAHNNAVAQMSADHIALFGISEATCSGIKRNEEKPKAPHLEDIHLYIPANAEDKKQNIEELTFNREEMVLEVLMANNPNVPAVTTQPTAE